MNNIEQQVKIQTLIASHPDKLESFITALESVLSPIEGEGDSEVAVGKQKAYNGFKIGDKVKISPDSEFYSDWDETNPTEVVGKIVRIESGSLPIFVVWPSGKENCYDLKDLIVVDPV